MELFGSPQGRKGVARTDFDMQQQRAETTVEALRRGRIPPYVEQRIQKQKDGRYPWTSDLSVSEWLLLQSYHLRPLGMVMGSSIYHIDLSTTDYISSNYANRNYMRSWTRPGFVSLELALLDGRKLALNRMKEEARLLGANAVVGVRLNNRSTGKESKLTEFTAFGTAVMLDGLKASSDPLLCTVSAVDFVKLLQAGSIPVTVGLGVAAYHQYYQMKDQRAAQKSRDNQEIKSLTDAVLQVRHRAVSNLHRQIAEVGGSGVLAHDIQLKVYREERILEFIALGTIVSSTSMPPSPFVHTAVSLDN